MTTYPQPKTIQPQESDFWDYHFSLNPGPLAEYFNQLLKKYPRDNDPGGEITPNWCRRNVINHLVGSRFWRENNIAKMLEWVEDRKTVNVAQIIYKEKYIGEFYNEEVADLEKTENEFIDTEVIPILKRQLAR